MKIIHTTSPDNGQKRDILALVEACKRAEPITLSAALEDGIDYFLSYDGENNDRLSGYSFLFFTGSPVSPDDNGNGAAEFTAFVHPAHRRKGHFTAMLNAAVSRTEQYEKEHGCSVDFLFISDRKSEDAEAVLKLIGAEYWYSEYTMIRGLSENDRLYHPEVLIERDAQSPGGSDLYAALLNGQAIGTCAVVSSGSRYYLYSFQIMESFRGRGYGRDFLLGMIALLASRAENPDAASASASAPASASASVSAHASVSVQVSGLNYIARNLYKKTGFRDAETLSYYIY